RHLVAVGRVVSLTALVVAMLCAKPLLGSFDQAFQYIQEFTGFFTPGIVVLFLLGVFWNRATVNGALCAALGSAILSIVFYVFWPQLPFIDRVGLVFLLCLGAAIVVSLVESKGAENNGVHKNAVDLSDVDMSTDGSFNFSAVSVALVLTAFYVAWW
ncbi:MAG: sodium transporter, partial [Exilibacterium sp.]